MKNMIIIITVVIFVLFATFFSEVYAVNFIELDADGEVRKVRDCRENNNEKFSFNSGNVRNGFLHEGNFFFFDNVLLKKLSMSDRKASDIKNIGALFPGSLPWYIGGVEKTKIYFSSYDDVSSQGDKKVSLSLSIYEIDLLSGDVSKVDLGGSIKSGYFTVGDSKIVFTDTDGKITSIEKGNRHSYGIVGHSPSISPNGNKIAYVKKGIIFETVNIFDVEKKTDREYVSIPLFMSAQPNIRWSGDGSELLVGAISDVRSPILILFNIEGDELCRKKSSSVNWFFVDR